MKCRSVQSQFQNGETLFERSTYKKMFRGVIVRLLLMENLQTLGCMLKERCYVI